MKEPNVIVLYLVLKYTSTKELTAGKRVEATYLGLPDKSVGVGVTQLLHDSLDSGAHLLRIGVPSVDHLQQRHTGVQMPTLWRVLRTSNGTGRWHEPCGLLPFCLLHQWQ